MRSDLRPHQTSRNGRVSATANSPTPSGPTAQQPNLPQRAWSRNSALPTTNNGSRSPRRALQTKQTQGGHPELGSWPLVLPLDWICFSHHRPIAACVSRCFFTLALHRHPSIAYTPSSQHGIPTPAAGFHHRSSCIPSRAHQSLPLAVPRCGTDPATTIHRRSSRRHRPRHVTARPEPRELPSRPSACSLPPPPPRVARPRRLDHAVASGPRAPRAWSRRPRPSANACRSPSRHLRSPKLRPNRSSPSPNPSLRPGRRPSKPRAAIHPRKFSTP